MERILFGIIGWNIAETTRMIEIANSLKEHYECHFFSYGGQFEYLVEKEGYTLHHLEPKETHEKIEHLWKIDRGESFKQPWTSKEVRQRINNEVALIEDLNPAAAFLGSVLTFSLSCKLTHTLLFNFVPLALTRPYLKSGGPISPFYPKLLNKIGSWSILNIPLLMKNIRKVSDELGLPEPRSFLELWEGDINIVAEIEELSLIKKLPENWYFSGPLFAHLETEIPPFIKEVLEFSDKPTAYFAMGSSANREILLNILQWLGETNINIIAPIKSHLKETDNIPSNVHVTDWLPALEVTREVDLAIIHGGQGTVQTTVSAGVPFIGIGMQPEQELNIYLYSQIGNAIQLKKRVRKDQLLDAVNKLLTDKQYKEKAEQVQIVISRNDTESIIRRIVIENINKGKESDI